MEGLREKIIDNLFELLRFEMNGELFRDEKIIVELDVLPTLFKFSKRHDLAHLVGDALDKKGLLPENSEAQKRFLNERNLAVMRYEQKRYEFTQICATLEKAKIPFMPLKGAIIQDLYPQGWMRTSCDIDILVKQSDLDSAINCLKNDLEYTCEFIGGHDAQMYAPSGVHLELHYTLTSNDATTKQKAIFEKVWEYEDNKETFERRMADEFFYGYFILHMAIHVKEGGCGIRPFLDLWLIKRKFSFDREKCEKFLQEIGLLTFAKEVESLAEVWFSKKEASDLDRELEQYVLEGGVYGTVQNRVLVKTEQKKGKFLFILSRIFLPYSQLKIIYPNLKKHPILFPFYQVKRWFNLLNKERRAQATRELESTINMDDEKSQSVAKLLKDLEL